MIRYSIVVPLYNEEKNLPLLHQEITEAMVRINASYELIWVDDKSTDDSLKIIRELARKNKNSHFVSFKTNHGQSAALAAGFAIAEGQFVITMDGDLQNNPADIAHMVPYLDSYDMVTGWRKIRNDNLIKRFSSKFANAVRNRLSGETIKDTGCSLKIMKTSYLKKIKMFTGMHRFLPTLMKMEGARVIEVEVSHRQRKYGATKYGVWDRAFSGLRDLLAVRWMKSRFIQYDVEESDYE